MIGHRPEQRQKAPIIFHVVCPFGIFAILIALLHTCVLIAQHKGYFPLLALRCSSEIVALIAIAAIWRLKRWGLYLYLPLVVFNNGLSLGARSLQWPSVVVPMFFLTVVFIYAPRLR